MPRLKLTPAIKEQVLTLNTAGLSPQDISARTGFSKASIYRWLRTDFKTLTPATCKNCGTPTTSKYGYCHNNDECLKLYHQVCNRLNKNKPDNRSRANARCRKHSTGMSPEMWNECWEIQQGSCGLCSTDLSKLRSFHVHADHVPESNPPKPRGILCSRCNTNWLGILEAAERAGDCQITNPQLIAWQTNPPMARSSFAEELGWLVCA